MGKMPWSRLKQQVESRFADTLRGRLELHTAHYRHAHDADGRLWLTIDGRELVNLCEARANRARWKLESELEAVLAPPNGRSADAAARKQASDQALELTRKQGILGQHEAYRALESYLDLAIEDAITSDNVLIRALSMADRRVGKRRLRALRFAPDAHPLVRELFSLRCSAEQIACEPPAA
jgi:hypothetical protein